MRLSLRFCKNLNVKHWNRRVWEIGYRGPLLPQRKATGRPDYPVSDNAVRGLHENFAREYEVMKCLASPFLSAEKEAPYIAMHGNFDERLQAKALEAEQLRMPGEVKRVTGYKRLDRQKGNIGNLLHSHRTVEDSMKELIQRQRWD